MILLSPLAATTASRALFFAVIASPLRGPCLQPFDQPRYGIKYSVAALDLLWALPKAIKLGQIFWAVHQDTLGVVPGDSSKLAVPLPKPVFQGFKILVSHEKSLHEFETA